MKKLPVMAILLIVTFQGVALCQQIYMLRDAYRAALTSNESVKIAEENVVQSESRVDQAWTYVSPRVEGFAGYTRYSKVLPPTGAFVFQPLTQLSAAVVLTQPLYTGGRTLAGLRTAETMREASSKDLSAARRHVVLNVATAYYGVLKAEKMMLKSRESVERMERHKQVTEREAATRRTKANISNLLRARTLVSQARITLTRDESNVRIARQKLHLLTTLPENAVLAEPDPLPEMQATLEELKAQALSNRDEYAVSRLNIDVAEENITIVKGGHRPQLYAEGGVQYLESHPSTMMDETIYYGGLRLKVPIFEGGLSRAELSEARSKRRQAELSQQYLQRSIESEVHEAYVDYNTVVSVLNAVKLQHDDAQANFQAVERLFAQGLAASIALIDAQQALFLAERELVHATYEHQLAILRVQRSTGLLEI